MAQKWKKMPKWWENYYKMRTLTDVRRRGLFLWFIHWFSIIFGLQNAPLNLRFTDCRCEECGLSSGRCSRLVHSWRRCSVFWMAWNICFSSSSSRSRGFELCGIYVKYNNEFGINWLNVHCPHYNWTNPLGERVQQLFRN